MIYSSRKGWCCWFYDMVFIFLIFGWFLANECIAAPAAESEDRRVLHATKHTSSLSSPSHSSHSKASFHVHNKHSIARYSSDVENENDKTHRESKGSKDIALQRDKETGKEKGNVKQKQSSKYMYKENTKNIQIIENNNVQMGVSFLSAVDQIPSSSSYSRNMGNLRHDTYDDRDSENTVYRKDNGLSLVLQQSRLVRDAGVTLANATTAITSKTADVTLPLAPDTTHLVGFARKKDWFGSAICNRTTMRDRTIDNTTAAAWEYYNIVDMLNICWISSLRNPEASKSASYVYTKATAKRKQYPMVPFKYLVIERTLYSDNQCTLGNEIEEELFQDQLVDLDRKYHQEYPEECRKSHMPIDDPLHANTVHSRVGDVVDDHDPRDDIIYYNKEIILKAYSRPEDCLSRSGHAIISATLPNCIVGPNHTSSKISCTGDGYEFFRYDGLDCDEEDVVKRETFTREVFCQNVLPVDAVLGFTSIQCPSDLLDPASSVAMQSSITSDNASENMSMYIRQPVDFKGFWSLSKNGGLTAGGIGILGLILFVASAFSFFRLKEGPHAAGVSDI